jgi:hypothetical protein
MKMNDVDLDAPTFPDHPAGWRSPSDVAAGFTLAWALELKERIRISPFDPFANGVRDRLPVQFRFDTLGKLIQQSPGSSGATIGRMPVVRLTTLCGAWKLFELLNEGWAIRPGDFGQFSQVLSFVTGGRDRRSLYGDLEANLSKCLLATRVRREFSQQHHLDQAEEWFVTGEAELTHRDSRGVDSLMFQVGPNEVPLGLYPHEFTDAVWSTARVLVGYLGPDRVIAQHAGRVESLSDLLVRGGEKAIAMEPQMPPLQFRYFDYWPGWS